MVWIINILCSLRSLSIIGTSTFCKKRKDSEMVGWGGFPWVISHSLTWNEECIYSRPLYRYGKKPKTAPSRLPPSKTVLQLEKLAVPHHWRGILNTDQSVREDKEAGVKPNWFLSRLPWPNGRI